MRAAEVHRVLVEVQRRRVEDAGPATPDSSVASRSAAAGQGRVAGLAVAAELEPPPGLGVQGEQHLPPVAESTRVPAVRWSGRQARSSPSGCASRWVDVPLAQRLLLGVGARPGPQRRQRVVVQASRSSDRVGAVRCRRRRTRCRAARPARRRSRRRSAPADAGRRPRGSPAGRRGRRRSAAGRGASRRASRASGPGGSAASPTASEASRSRRGRSSRPTSAANVCSAGPPAARRRRTASCSLAGGRHPVGGGLADDLVDPALDQRERDLEPVSAACWAGVFSGSNSPPSSASCIASGLRRVDARASAPRSLWSMSMVDAAAVVLDRARSGARAATARARTAAGGRPRAARGRAARRPRRRRARRRTPRRWPARSAALPAGPSGQADVGGAEHLAGERAERLRRPGCRTSRRRPCRACRSAGRPSPGPPRAARCPCAATTCSATGSTSTFQTSMVCSTHSARLQAAVVVTPEGKLGGRVEPVVGEPDGVGDRVALPLRSGTGRAPAATVLRARSWRASQFTGPSCGASSPGSG